MKSTQVMAQASDILMQAKSGDEKPHGWVVFPLSRNKVIIGMIGWVVGISVGLGLFAIMSAVAIPYNYEHGPLAAIVSTLFLGIFLFIGFGSIWALGVDIRRLSQAHNHIIVLTPQEFLKQEGEKIIHVPLTNVRNVTARGKAPTQTSAALTEASQLPSAGENVLGFIVGRGFTPSGRRWRSKRMRTPTSLAFIDTRDESEVTVVTDEAYGDPFMIAALIKQYASNVQNAR